MNKVINKFIPKFSETDAFILLMAILTPLFLDFENVLYIKKNYFEKNDYGEIIVVIFIFALVVLKVNLTSKTTEKEKSVITAFYLFIVSAVTGFVSLNYLSALNTDSINIILIINIILAIYTAIKSFFTILYVIYMAEIEKRTEKRILHTFMNDIQTRKIDLFLITFTTTLIFFIYKEEGYYAQIFFIYVYASILYRIYLKIRQNYLS